VGSGVPARVTYWTGTWDPTKEAISKEIALLRCGPRASAPLVAFSPAHASQLHLAERVLKLSSRRWVALRAAARLIEPWGDITHVFGGRSSWHLLRAVGRRPVLLTAVLACEDSAELPQIPIARVVVEVDDAVDEWVAAGIPRDRIEVLPPGIDLDRFRPMPSPEGRFTLLFASTPSDAAEIGPRGIDLLVELARQRPDIDVLLPWRQWGDLGQVRAAIDRLRPPANVLVEHGDVPDMRACYARAHATVAMFARGRGKACPNFVIEGLACGRPSIMSAEAPLAGTIAGAGAGLAVARDVRALSGAVDQAKERWSGLAAGARALAEQRFDEVRFVQRYEQIYAELKEGPDRGDVSDRP
jgi:glycosyltransferase involved in cell wall biosynthesis